MSEDTDTFPGYAITPTAPETVPADGMYVILKQRLGPGSERSPFLARLHDHPQRPAPWWVIMNSRRGFAASERAIAEPARGLVNWFETAQRGKGRVVSLDYEMTHVAVPLRQLPNGDYMYDHT